MGKLQKILPSYRGLAYLATANFLSRIILLLDKFINSFFSYEMVLLYSAHLDTHILLFFQAVFMIPVALLAILIFYGIEKQSFNLVLYPTLMLLFLILLRYGSEFALLIIHWEAHYLDRGPSLIYYLVLDIIAIVILLLYVYFTLAAPTANTLTPSRAASLRRRFQRFSFNRYHNATAADLEAPLTIETPSSTKEDGHTLPVVVGFLKKQKPPAPAPEGEEFELNQEPPPRPPPSPKFNYKLRRNISQLAKDVVELAKVEELDKRRQRNSQVSIKEEDELDTESGSIFDGKKTQSLKLYETEPKRRSLIIETDLDAKGSTGKKSPSSRSPSPRSPSPRSPSPRSPTPPHSTAIEPEPEPAFEITATITLGNKRKNEIKIEDEQLEAEKNAEDDQWQYEEETENKENLDTITTPNEGEEYVTTTSSTGYKTTAV